MKIIRNVNKRMIPTKLSLGNFLVCEIGYCISKAYWNKGVTTEALKAVINFLIKEVKVERVHAFHNINNVASGKVMLKAGMIFEGKLRKYHLNRDEVLEDVNMYSKINTDRLCI